MYKMVKRNVALLSITASSFMLLPWASVEGRNAPPEEAPRGRPVQAQPRVDVAQERAAQEQAVRGEQEQARAQRAEEMKQAESARQQQEVSFCGRRNNNRAKRNKMQ